MQIPPGGLDHVEDAHVLLVPRCVRGAPGRSVHAPVKNIQFQMQLDSRLTAHSMIARFRALVKMQKCQGPEPPFFHPRIESISQWSQRPAELAALRGVCQRRWYSTPS